MFFLLAFWLLLFLVLFLHKLFFYRQEKRVELHLFLLVLILRFLCMLILNLKNSCGILCFDILHLNCWSCVICCVFSSLNCSCSIICSIIWSFSQNRFACGILNWLILFNSLILWSIKNLYCLRRINFFGINLLLLFYTIVQILCRVNLS